MLSLQESIKALEPHDHLCLIYESYEEWKKAIVPFMIAGLDRGDKCLYVVDSSTADQIRIVFREAGLDVEKLEQKGQLAVVHETQAYSREGFFDPDSMIRLLIEETEKALDQGYPALRVTGEMSWVLRGYVGSDRLLEYEAKLNRDLFPHYPCTGICQYDRNKFAPSIIKGVILTHPLLIKGEQIYKNFYYLDPEDYLGHEKSGREVEHWLENLERERCDREELKLRQDQLEESMGKYRKLAESAGAILWEYDILQDAWTYVAPQVKWILGYDPEEWENLSFWTRHIHPEDREWVSQYCAQCAERGEDHVFEYRFLRKDGSVAWLQDDVNVELKNGKPVKLRGFMIDITERKQAENALRNLNQELERRVRERTAQLEASNREMEAFTYSVSHDLRSPLRAVEGFTRILLEEYGEVLDEEGHRLLRVIYDNTQQMDQLITDLLVLSRATRHQIRKETVDMTGLVKAICSEVVPEDGRGRLDITVGELPEGIGDPTLLKQAWQNLLSNAVKYTEPRDKALIEVGGYFDNGEQVYYVKDNGVGFDPQYIHKIFGVFQRLHGTGEFTGTGIGLAIVQRVIERHDGKVWAQGSPGEGAAFYFSLPAGESKEVQDE